MLYSDKRKVSTNFYIFLLRNCFCYKERIPALTFYKLNTVWLFNIHLVYTHNWRPPILSQLTSIIFNKELTHLGSVAQFYVLKNYEKMYSKKGVKKTVVVKVDFWSKI